MGWLFPGVTCRVLWCLLAVAQQGDAPMSGNSTTQPPSDTAKVPIKEAPFSIYYATEGESGKLVPVINWTIEEIEQWYNQSRGHQQPDQAPRYNLQLMSAEGTAKGDHADLTIQFRIWIRDEFWTRVPLRLDESLLQEGGFEYKGSGRCFLVFEEKGEGYVAWIRSDPEQNHEITLKVLAPLATIGNETRLRLLTPQVPGSDLKLTVPSIEAVGELSEAARSAGATLSTPTRENGNTEFKAILGLGGDFELRWRDANGRPAEMQPVLRAEGAVLAQVDGHGVNAKADFEVAGHGTPFDRFMVRLPQGAELIAGNQTGYSVSRISNPSEDKKGLLVEVSRAKKLTEPMQVRLSVRQSPEAADAAGWFELAGFDVIDAVRQSGHIAVTTVGDWQVRCVPNRGVRQVDELPQALQTDDLVAGFEYFSQPCSLKARVFEVKTRVSVRPEYSILVEKNMVRLQANLKYTVRGAKISDLDVELPGWQLDDVGPDDVVDVDRVAELAGVLLIPLLQSSTGQIEVWVRARRELPSDTSSLSLALPRPLADSLAPAVLAVLPADNVELTPDDERMEGLARQQMASQLELPKWQQAPLYYRGETSEAVFAADFKTHEQQITVDVTSEINLVQQEETVQQTMDYTIAYEPADKLTIDVPQSLSGSDTFKVFLDGELVSPTPLPDEATSLDGAVRLRIALPGPRIGQCELLVRYPVEKPRAPAAKDGTRVVPLVMPALAELSSNQLSVTAPPHVTVKSREGPWRIPDKGNGYDTQPGVLRLVTDGRADQVVLAVDGKGHQSTIVERTWIQTLLTRNGRYERAVFRFVSDRKQVELTLPPAADSRRVTLLLGEERPQQRKPPNVERMPDGRLIVALPEGSIGRRGWLEVEYEVSSQPRDWGRTSMELPRLGGEVWVRRMYWQLVLPRNEHLIVAPGGFTQECKWGWCGTFWGRIPVMEQAHLEHWVGATPRTEVSRETSRYLFSSMGPMAQTELQIAGRSWIVLGASLVALVGGLLLINVPASRHPATLLTAAILLVSIAVVYPTSALLAAQAAVAGLVLALAAGLLRGSLIGRRGLFRDTPSSVLDRGSTQAQYRPPAEGDRVSIETASTAVHVPSPDTD